MSQKIWVTGDQTIDWALMPDGRYTTRSADDRLHVAMKLYWHAGGAFQLASLSKAALHYARQGTARTVRPALSLKQRDITAYGSSYNHSFSVLRDYGGVKRVEQFLGFRGHNTQVEPGPLKFPSPPKNGDAEVILIDDADLGFRNSKSDWTKVIELAETDACKWVLLKMSHGIKDDHRDTLWNAIRQLLGTSENLRKKLIVVTAASRLRDADAEISKGLSWDQAAEDVLYEIENHNKLTTLRACPRLIVSFGPSGAIFIEHDEVGSLKWRLTYNRELLEREWTNAHKKGMMFGYGSVLCSAIACELATSRDGPEFNRAIKRGLIAMQKLYEQGFKTPSSGDLDRQFRIPDEIFEISKEDLLDKQFCDTPAAPRIEPAHSRKVDFPPILSASSLNFSDRLKVALQGKDGLPKHIPVGCFGKLVTVDHTEIESLHQVYNLIDTYCIEVPLNENPLAISVFGAPGSGKGFAIKQLTAPWMRDNDGERSTIAPLEFNLSQLNTASDLVGALHQVRDIALDGKVPLVLWDEFDSPLEGQPLGWLRYFLSPIQDGKFQQDEVTHLIGPCIFVFAGGTSENFEKFKQEVKRLDAEGRGSKGEDFLSRMRGNVDIPGVNPPSGTSKPGPTVMLRRALVLNSMFDKFKIANDGEKFEVEEGVVQAFMEVSRYEHGVRSMEAIIRMSNLRGRERYTRASLPSLEQLKLHVDGEEFLEKMRSRRHS
ncbi:hypothetical protein [Streptomyces sp. NRRL F-2580]|uniref:hypothetical protein n=1 Tax=Streptomyces sp. NRRL F-2580 TaxID=1463841 RepID=UPI000B1793CC|nr:hypothetical protein [Streptomyces sp. NRRL F-2580]